MADRASRRKRQARVQAIRRAIIGAVAVVVVVLGGVGIYYGTGVGVGDAAEGQHYRLVEGGDGAASSGPVEVVEYFSYACVHCWNFDPLVEAFADRLPEGATLRRAHVRYNSSLALLARAHAALTLHGAATVNHERIFRAMHDRQRQFATAEAIADYVAGHGIEREAFLALMESPRVARLVAEDDAAARAAGVVAVPALVVADKYVVNMDVGRKQALAIAEELARRELAERQAQRTGEA